MEDSIYDKAQVIMTERREKAILAYEKRVDEINRKLPQIREINEQIYNTGRELIKIIASGKSRPQVNAEIEKLRTYNTNAQTLSQRILMENGYPPDYLTVHYQCEKCSDTGYTESCLCDCMKRLCASLSTAELNKKAQLELSDFASFSLEFYEGEERATMERILNYCRNYAQNFSIHSDSILMTGKTGLGKTHLSLAIAGEILKSGYSVIYDSSTNILRSIENEHFREHTSDLLDLVMETDLLIIDDLGTEFESRFSHSVIYNIINTRLNRRKPIIISTNLDYETIRSRYDERIVSRITAAYTCMEFKGTDVRYQKKALSVKGNY